MRTVKAFWLGRGNAAGTGEPDPCYNAAFLIQTGRAHVSKAEAPAREVILTAVASYGKRRRLSNRQSLDGLSKVVVQAVFHETGVLPETPTGAAPDLEINQMMRWRRGFMRAGRRVRSARRRGGGL